jgi:chorismate mutase
MSFEHLSKIIDALREETVLPEQATEEDIRRLRERIDEIDRALVELLNQRSTAANIIGFVKKRLGLPVYVPKREEQVVANVIEANDGPLNDESVRRLFERIIDETRSLERQKYQNDEDEPE